MRQVLICSLIPQFDRDSGSRRVLDMIGFLQEAGWAVTFAAHHQRFDKRYVRVLEQRGVAVYGNFKTGEEELSAIEQLVGWNHYDLAVFAWWNVAEPIIRVVRRLSPVTRIVVDSVDLHFVREARRIAAEPVEDSPSRVLDLEYAQSMIQELNTYASTDAVFTVSEIESVMLNALIGDRSKAFAVPDNEELAPSTCGFRERRGILFVGFFPHTPNVSAAKYLCGEILPRLSPDLLKEHPVYVVGYGLDEKVASYAHGIPNVHLVGWVPSLLPYYQHARITVVPLLYGAGTKRKMIQALMVGTPTVSTSIGIEGLNLRHGEHVLVADDPDSFGRAIQELLENEELWQRLACQGREHIMLTHSREAVRKRFSDVMAAVMGQARERTAPSALPLETNR